MTICVSKSETLFSLDQTKELDPLKIPEHIAIIMDGNRRWAKKHNYPIISGHWKGAEALTRIVRAASELGIKAVTVYAFSTENWGRSNKEVWMILRLFQYYLKQKRSEMCEDGVRLNVIGDASKFPLNLQKTLSDTIEATKHSNKIDLILALNYGSRDEICRAMKKICTDVENQKIQKSDINERLIARYLDTNRWKDPDLLIRTSGEMRLSNFLLWQVSYTEVVITKTLWPDFSERHLLRLILEYQQRERRLGKK